MRCGAVIYKPGRSLCTVKSGENAPLCDSFFNRFVVAFLAHASAFSPIRAISPIPVRKSNLKLKLHRFVLVFFRTPVRSLRSVLYSIPVYVPGTRYARYQGIPSILLWYTRSRYQVSKTSLPRVQNQPWSSLPDKFIVSPLLLKKLEIRNIQQTSPPYHAACKSTYY